MLYRNFSGVVPGKILKKTSKEYLRKFENMFIEEHMVGKLEDSPHKR